MKKIILFIMVLMFIPVAQATPQICITSIENITYNYNSLYVNWTSDNYNNLSSVFYIINDTVNVSFISSKIIHNSSNYDTNDTTKWNTLDGGSTRTPYGMFDYTENDNYMTSYATAYYLGTSDGYVWAEWNYTLPVGTHNGSLNVEYDLLLPFTGDVNLTVPFECVSSGISEFRIFMNLTEFPTSYYSTIWCQNSTNEWFNITDGLTSVSMYSVTDEELYLTGFYNSSITLNDGVYDLTIYANDTSNNANSTIVYFTVDTTPPVYDNVTNPGTITQGNGFIATIDTYDDLSDVNYSLVEFDGVNYTLVVGVGNTRIVTLTAPALTSARDFNLTFFINDTMGNSFSTYITFEVEPGSVGTGSSEGATDTAVTPTPSVGDFQVYPSGRVELFTTEGVDSPEVDIYIINGNTTQNFGVFFDDELLPYCMFTEYPSGTLPRNAHGVFSFRCRIPPEVVISNVNVVSATSHVTAIPVIIGPSIGFLPQMGDFLRLIMSGDWDSLILAYHGVPIIVLIVFILVLFYLVYRW